MRHVARAIGLLILMASPSQAQDGQTAYNNACRTCHSMKADDNRLGPSLAGVVGRKAGALEGFAYSDSLKNSGLEWDRATLDRFIENPDAVILGHRMKPYGGLTDAAQRATIIGFLKSAQ